MLTAETVIAKVVSFIVNKIAGQISDIPFDKRRKACRSLTKLYYCVQALDDLTENVLGRFNDFQKWGHADAVVNSLNSHMREIQLTTNMFIELGSELQAGLAIVDPALARCCDVLYISKFDFLTFLSTSIEWDRTTSPPKILVKRPLGKMEAVDMENMYELSAKELQSGNEYFWPDSEFYEFNTDFEDVRIGFDDEETAIQVLKMIRRQNLLLKEAKDRLRNLIKDTFSVEEILFQSDSHPFR
jgi:hypothetical protein